LSGAAQSVRGSVIRQLDAPASVLRRLAARFPERYPMLFDSAAEGALSRMSILAAEPQEALVAHSSHADFLKTLERRWQDERIPSSKQALPFTGGWVLFLSYELAGEIEPRLRLPASDLPWRAFALRTPCAIIHDRLENRVFAVAEPQAAHLLPKIERDVHEAASMPAPASMPISVAAIDEESPEIFLERVRRAQGYIRAGDIYQANLSRSWHIELAGNASVAEIYERLCAANPAPFAALAQWQGVSILSSSPERLVSVNDGLIQTRPIAGTRPRSGLPGGDVSEMTELAMHPKERAEHVMLIDLERSDLGRVCKPGTVRVDEFMSIESYAHVHHIVSNVSGQLRGDATPIEAIRAVFPGGTITGCPKIRCMEIIAELEGVGRGAYTGSLGFLGLDGTMDLNILIRTMTLRGRRIDLRAGGGIVADSVPARELEETRAKARGLLAAFDSAPAAARKK
jgi:anthranilate synthase component 1